MNSLTHEAADFINGMDINVHSVTRPPTWRDQAYTLTYLLVDRELDAIETLSLLRWATNQSFENVRIISPDLIKWSSLFHPRFYRSVVDVCPAVVTPLSWTNQKLSDDHRALTEMWMQSVLFLSGVTLSAAIIQNRFSTGTVGSKLDRLWDAGTLSLLGLFPELGTLHLHDAAKRLATDSSDDVTRLLLLRELYMKALAMIAPEAQQFETMKASIPMEFDDGRFGFVDELRTMLGRGVQAIVAYGSSVSSKSYADIDAIVIVDDPVAALKRMAGKSPVWRDKELNLGLYSAAEFEVMQRLSGDNLADYGVCLWGEIEAVRKPVAELLARNFSFGIVRQRQQYGMLSRAVAEPDMLSIDKRSLYEYFVKIPANVAKGTWGVIGERWPKERVHRWLRSKVGFDTPVEQQAAVKGRVCEALAASSSATGRTLSELNKILTVVEERNDRHIEERSRRR